MVNLISVPARHLQAENRDALPGSGLGGGREKWEVGMDRVLFYGVSQSLQDTWEFCHQEASLFSRRAALGSALPLLYPSTLSTLAPESASESEI